LDLVERGYTDAARDFLAQHRDQISGLHAGDLQGLTAVTSAQAVLENPVAVQLRQYRYTLSLSAYAFELMMIFLHEASFKLILSLLNRYVSVRVYAGQPSDEQDRIGAFEGVAGASTDAIADLNAKKIHWSLYDDQKTLFGVLDKPEGADGGAGAAADGAAPRGGRGRGAGAAGAAGAGAGTAAAAAAAAAANKKRDEPPTPLPVIDVNTQAAILEDVAARATLSSSALPSVALFTFLHTHESLNSVALSDDGALVAAGFADSSVKLWNVANQVFDESVGADDAPDAALGDALSFRKLVGHAGPVYGTSFSPDNHWLLSASEDTTVRLWSTETAQAVCCYAEHNYAIWDVAFSPMGYYFATASHDRTARVWSTDRVRSLRTFVGHLSDVNAVQFHPNCTYVASGSSDKCARLWDINTGQCVRLLTGHFGPLYALAFSPDGKLLATAGDDETICVWDLASAKCTARLKGHRRTIWSLAFSKCGTLLSSGSHDRTVRVWDARGAGSGAQQALLDNASGAGAVVDAAVAAAAAGASAAASVAANAAPSAHVADPLLLKTLHTKRTPVFALKFTRRNLLLGAGGFVAAGK
jgi:transcription initiation factor TFIID subunit 5